LLEAVLPFCLFFGAALFTYVGIDLFSRGWESYEQRYVEGAQRTLAAMYLSLRPQHLLYLSVLGFFVLGALGIALFGSWGVGVAAGVLGFSLPGLIILWMKKRRDSLFRQQIPGMVDTVSRGLKSGLSLPQCFQVIERELPNPMSQEFRVLNQQMRLGMPADQALRSLLERMPNADLDLIIAAVNVSTELGGNLTEILGNIAQTVRERFMLEGKIRTLTSQGRLQAIVLSAMPVLLFFALHVVNPVLMRPMYTTAWGWAMILGALVWEALGVFFLWKIVAIKA